jgi:hypothetical protein
MLHKLKRTPSDLDLLTSEILTEMKACNADSDEFKVMLKRLERVYKLKTIDGQKRVSPDVVASIAGNLAGIVLILHFEKVNVVASKALGFVMKLK